MAAPRRDFPPEFLFGAATAAYQIEGAALTDGRRDSIWDAFARTPGAVINGDSGLIACDHYHRYREDVALMKDLGLQAYRFSTSWSRVRPDGGAINLQGVDFYSRLVDELLEAEIVPWLTLYHWDLPQKLQDVGGWTARDTAERFTEYALDMHAALGDRVPVWTTLNEPWCASFLSYTAGAHAPGHFSGTEGLLAAHHLLLGHGQVARELHARDESLNVGVTLNLAPIDAVNPDDPRDVDAARRIDGQLNRWFLDPIFRGEYPQDIFAEIADDQFRAAVRDGDLATIAAPITTLGVNYYHGEFVAGTPSSIPVEEGDAPTDRRIASPFISNSDIFWHDRGLPRTPMNWEVQPEGLTRLLRRVADDYTSEQGVALVVTENGAAYDDEVVETAGVKSVPDSDRVEFLREHLGAVLDAIDAGIDVRGYFYWSFLDNYEWAWGYEKRFGIVRVDYDSQERTVKNSGLEYAKVIERRAL